MSDEFVFPVSSAQRRFWFMHAWDPTGIACNVPIGFRLRGPLNLDALERALQHIVQRHEALRTTFALQGDEPVQIVQAASVHGSFLRVHDLQALLPEAGAAEGRRIVADEIQRPFDLTRGPLLRALVVRLGSEDAVLVVTTHHIVCDGWGLGILVEELGAGYETGATGTSSGSAPLDIQYADYSLWQRQLEDERKADQLAYWRGCLDGALPSLSLSTDHPRPAVPSGQGARCLFSIPVGVMARLQDLSSAEGATLFMALLTAFATLLHRYTQQDDLLVAVPVAGRHNASLERLIGCFVNTLAIRTDLAGNPSFRALLSRVRAATLGAYANQDVPFEAVVQDLQPGRDARRVPLCQAAFVLQNTPECVLHLKDVASAPLPLWTTSAKFDLTMTIASEADAWVGMVEYRTDLFESTTIARMAEHYLRLLDGIAASLDCDIDRLPMLSAVERSQLLVTWNETRVPYPADRSVSSLFEERAAQRPEAIAACCDGRAWSYQRLDAEANQLATELRNRGAGSGGVVAVCRPRSLEALASLLAVLKVGAAYVPIDPAWGSERQRFVIDDSAACVVIGANAIELVPVRASIPAPFPDATNRGGDLAYLMYTSGSTGEPKAVAITHRGIARLVINNDAIRLTDADVVLHASPLTFDASTFEIWGALLNGGRLAIVPTRRPSLAELGDVLVREAVSVAWFTADLFQQMVEDQLERMRLVPQVIAGGDVVSPSHALEFLRAGGRALINGYGPTENTTFTCCHRMTDPRDVGRTVPIGRPIANTTVFVLDRNQQPVPVGVPGELYTGGDGLARGYVNRPELTAEKFVAHPFSHEPGARLYRTGDRVRYRPDGCLEFLGRIDRQVKIRGFRVEPDEIEAALDRSGKVREAAVVAHDGGNRGKLIVGYIVLAPGSSVDDVKSHLARQLPDYMVPAAFVTMAGLPRTTSGKLDRRALPPPEFGRDGSERWVSPTPIEEVLAGLWREVLDVNAIDVHDDFFALGGHSLLAMQLVSRIRTSLGRTVSIAAVFEHPTLAALARHLAGADRADDLPPPSAIRDRPSTIPLSFAQRRLWFLAQLRPGDPSYHVDLMWRLQGPVDADALGRALTAIVARHEILRTTFPAIDGEPAQVVHEAGRAHLTTIDWRARPEASREPALDQLVQTEAMRPFDLTQDPLLRATLVRLTDADAVLLLVLHHIVCDGWSINVLGRELSQGYVGANIWPVPLQYADYAAWQQRWISSRERDRQLAYWTRQLDGAPAALNLPTDRAQPLEPSTSGRRATLAIPADLTEALTALGRRHGATLHMVLLAGFGVLLSRHANESDIVIGSPTASRSHVELEPLIGFFVNTLALRIRLDGDPSGAEVIRRVRTVALDAYTHADLPFEAVVDALHAARTPGRTPIFQVMFVLQNEMPPLLTWPGVDVTMCPPREGTAKFDLLLVVRERGAVLQADFEYRTDLFDAATIDRLAQRFLVLLDSLAADDQRPVSTLGMLPASEYQQLTRDWNDTAAPYPQTTLDGLFAADAARQPSEVVLISGGQSLTRADVETRAAGVASKLVTLGVSEGDVVGVCAGRSAETLIAMLASLKAGAAYLPLNPADPPDRLIFMLRDAGARAVVAENDVLAMLRRRMPELPALGLRDQPCESSDTPPEIAIDPDRIAYVMYTSGSTGEPKGVAVPHRAVVRLVYGLDRVTGPPASRFLQLSPLHFDASTFDIWVPLLRGGQCVLFEDDAPTVAALERAIRRFGIECLWLTSSLFNAIVDERATALSGVRDIFVGGEALSPRHVATALAALPAVRLVNGYGPTEATTFTCCHPIERPFDPAGPIPIGRPLANTRLFVLDARGGIAPIGVTGELYIGGDGLARGYLGRAAAADGRFTERPLHGLTEERVYRTGDLVRYRPDGVLDFVGRIDRQIKIRGFRIEPGEIEACLECHSNVRQAAVDTCQIGSAGPALIAYVVLRPETDVTASELRTFVAGRLPEYMVPLQVVILDGLPLGSTGKLDRAALPEPAREQSPRSGSAPTNDTERRLTDIWRDVLGIEATGVDQNFFEAGGHSLLAVRLVARLEQVFGRAFPVSTLFHAPTIASLARAIESARPATQSLVVPMQPHGTRPAVVFVHALGGEVWSYVPLVRRLGADQPCFGLQLPDMPGEDFPTIEALAARYADALIETVPGPYVVAGYSSGATIAFELAHQLSTRGAAVPLLVSLDGGLPNRGSAPGRASRIAGIVQNVPWWIRYDLLETPPTEMAKRIRVKVAHWFDTLARRHARRAATRGFDIRDERGQAITWGPSHSRQFAAIMAYRPQVRTGRVLVVKARARPLAGPHEADLGWHRKVSGPLSVTCAPGSHETFLREPYVQAVATSIRQHIDRAMATGDGTPMS